MSVGMGFQQLTNIEQNAYQIIHKALQAYSTTIDASQIDKQVDIMKVLQTVLGDNPEIIYFDKTQVMTTELLFKKQIKLLGCLSRTQLNKVNNELANKVNNALSSIRNSLFSDYETIKAVYEYLQQNIKYDEKELIAYSSGKSRNHNSHNAYGALVNGLAVCDGISAAFSLLVQKLGYACMAVHGRSTFRSDGLMKHAWSIIQVNKKPYHVDATWDVNHFSDFNEFSYEYFLVSDDEIATDHEWDIKTTPVCSSMDISYYFQNKLYANNNTQLEDIIKKDISRKQNVMRFKLSYNISLPQDPKQYLSKMVLNSILKTGKSAQIRYDWDENTRCFFAVINYS